MSNIQSEKGVNVGKNTPIDYTLAGVGGLLGGPIDVPLSILTIHLLAPHAGAQQKWLVWLLCGVLGVPLSWGVLAGFTSATQQNAPQTQEQVAPESLKDQVDFN